MSVVGYHRCHFLLAHEFQLVEVLPLLPHQWVNLSCHCGASYCVASHVAHHRLSKGCCYIPPRCCSEIGAVLQSSLRSNNNNIRFNNGGANLRIEKGIRATES
ncbi:hypothetical protein V8G54_003415 [Vigna mungo]|uniref:Uncharacterized protein n=1 Tax=Vigna mungo TaxID=3915 RepID=A0AAQ3SDT4_VIGMU